ncbi:MAG: DUF1566 domain-containing protein [Verrucomicrobia bacterium]|nr:DUF1566 domain-containing protein [Verrucomicrobiota bacterium]
MKCLFFCSLLIATAALAGDLTYPIVDTGQTVCYDNSAQISPPREDRAFYGQDAQVDGNQPSYTDNGDGTVSDNVTGLMWVKSPSKTLSTFDDAVKNASECRVGGYADWRLPTIKELYSLILFSGETGQSGDSSVPYIDTKAFAFFYGDEIDQPRFIDVQCWTTAEYTGATMGGNPTVFGVNFADGRIKGYPKTSPRGEKELVVRYVRGNPEYGKNKFVDNGDGTVADEATGLMWQQSDSGKGMNWEDALAYAKNMNLAGHSDWRLPNAKELQSILDYSPIPAIDQKFFNMSDPDAWYWSGTTHLDGPPDRRGQAAVYVAFGEATGWMQMPPNSGNYRLLDVHGAGAQRSDPKAGNPDGFPHGRGPQGDVIRITNLARCVRDLD